MDTSVLTIKGDRSGIILVSVYKPNIYLKPYVKCYWSLQSTDHGGVAERKYLLSDSGMKISFNLADPVEFDIKGSNLLGVPEACLIGPSTHNFWLQASGRLNRFGIQFRPGGAYPFISIPAYELRDKIIELETILGNSGQLLMRRIQNPKQTTKDRIQILEKFLMQKLERSCHCDSAFDFAKDTILTYRGLMVIEQLSRAMHISNRKLERNFNQKVGIPPKLFAGSYVFAIFSIILPNIPTPAGYLLRLTVGTIINPISFVISLFSQD